jgi:hypothetical protein
MADSTTATIETAVLVEDQNEFEAKMATATAEECENFVALHDIDYDGALQHYVTSGLRLKDEAVLFVYKKAKDEQLLKAALKVALNRVAEEATSKHPTLARVYDMARVRPEVIDAQAAYSAMICRARLEECVELCRHLLVLASPRLDDDEHNGDLAFQTYMEFAYIHKSLIDPKLITLFAKLGARPFGEETAELLHDLGLNHLFASSSPSSSSSSSASTGQTPAPKKKPPPPTWTPKYAITKETLTFTFVPGGLQK